MSLRVAIEVLEVRHFLVVQILQRGTLAVLAEPLADSSLTSMPKRRVTDIVSEAGRLHDGPELVFVDILGQVLLDEVENRNRKATPHARDLDTVRESAMHVVVHRERVNLRLAAKPAESRRKDNAVVIPVIIGTVRVLIGRMSVTRSG